MNVGLTAVKLPLNQEKLNNIILVALPIKKPPAFDQKLGYCVV
jgi:hypothetical protein